MSDQIYNVQIVAQPYDSATTAKLAALFKKSEAQILAALAKGNIVAKRNIDQLAAAKYKNVIEQKTGALCIIVSSEPLPDDSSESYPDDYPEVVKPAATKAHPPSSPAETSPKRTWFWIAGLLSVLLILSGIAYNIWTTSPGYSLLQINRAINDRDLSLFRKHVDYDTLISRGLEATMARELDEALPADNAWGALGNQVGAGIANLMRPALTKKLSAELEKMIEEGSPADITGAQPLDAIAASLTALEQDGKQASAHAAVKHPQFEDQTFTLIFRLRDMEGYWQMFEISNLRDYLDWRSQQEAHYLAKANALVLAAIDNSLGDISYNTQRLLANPFLGPELRVVLKVENTGSEAIRTLYCDIAIVRLDDGQVLTEQSLSWGNGSLLLKPGDSAQITKDISSFADPELKNYLANPAADPGSELKIDIQVSSISFVDGSELVLHRTFADLR